MAVNELIKLIWTWAHLDISKLCGFGGKKKTNKNKNICNSNDFMKNSPIYQLALVYILYIEHFVLKHIWTKKKKSIFKSTFNLRCTSVQICS